MRKPTTSLCLWLPCFAMLASVLCTNAQRTTHIPADVSTLQAAIDAAAAGDTLIVAPGTYFENLNLRGKAITLTSSEGPAVTILDGRNLAPVVTFAGSETRATTLSGFTLQHGAPASDTVHGGGILLVGSAPTLTGNLLTQNLCTGVTGTNAAPLLTRNTITRTQAGAGCTTQPVAPVVLAGITSPLQAELRDNIIEHNDLTGFTPISAGIALLGTTARLMGNIVRDNTASNDAPSAIALQGAIALVQQNLIYANTSRCGPAVSVDAATTVQLLNSTIADNLSSPDCPQPSPAAELALAENLLPGQVLVANNIFASSTAHPALACSTAPAMQNNLLHNTAGPTLSNTCTADGLFADPLFTNRAQADYHLLPHSPAVDMGSSTIAPLPERDLDDAPRTQNGRIDLGVYEHAQPRTLAASTILLNASPNPAEAFQRIALIALIAQVTAANATPTGSITFSANAQPLTTVALDATGHAAFTTTTLAAGTSALSASYSGSDAVAPSTSTPTERIAPATTLLSFALTPSSADETQTVSLSASVQAPLSTQVPTGQVRFSVLNPPSAPTVLATATLDATGHATMNLPTLPTGTWLIDAAYLGTPNFQPIALPASDALTLSIAARGYTLTSASNTVTIQSGHHTSVALTLKSLGTFASVLTLSCANLPANASCTFSPVSPSLTASETLAVTLTLETNAVPGFMSVGLPLLALAGFRRRRRAILPLCLLAGLSGCTSKYPAQVPTGTYSIQVISQATGLSPPVTLPLSLVVTE